MSNKPHDCNSAYQAAVKQLSAEPAAASVTIKFVSKTTGLTKFMTVHRDDRIDVRDTDPTPPSIIFERLGCALAPTEAEATHIAAYKAAKYGKNGLTIGKPRNIIGMDDAAALEGRIAAAGFKLHRPMNEDRLGITKED